MPKINPLFHRHLIYHGWGSWVALRFTQPTKAVDAVWVQTLAHNQEGY
ncbi:hypothetical protein AmaxDRAFT_2689 [Limnospira maxima CS-328]|uniref:Uncharacterized protein n=1 Tax=Limnospira maxima CS-328 TaxID=513049 RepID=B5W1P2_LIMMA|nr:hypothetical protein AmaxDRAFT_2689 [Limnospira maxima CS-328]